MKAFAIHLVLLISFFQMRAPAMAAPQSRHLQGIADYKSPKDSATLEAFVHLKSLVGDWTGTFHWSGGRSSEGKMDARYYLTGNGSALVEDLLMDGKPVMTSVYHLDGLALRMTHYCAAGNQPRLKADSIDEAKKTIHFGFVDATNLTSLLAAHVHGLEIQFQDKDNLSLIFTFRRADALSYEHIELSRKKTI